jgi:hypothetical protein
MIISPLRDLPFHGIYVFSTKISPLWDLNALLSKAIIKPQSGGTIVANNPGKIIPNPRGVALLI